MRIKLNLTLVDIVNKKEITLNFEGSKLLKEILYEIGLSEDHIGMALKNGRWSPIDCLVEETDTLELFPHLEGG